MSSSPQQPKKPAGGGFGQFVAEKRPEFQAKCKGQPVSAVSKLAGQEWKALSEAEQEPYKKAFLAAQKQYATDLETFLAAGGIKQKGAAAMRSEKKKAKEGKLKKQKDPNAPKRPAGGAYGCFLAAHRAEFQQQCPGSVTGVTKLAGEKWKAASAGEKEKYEKEYKLKVDAHKEAMKSYVPPVADGDDDEPPTKKAKISKEDKTVAKNVKKDEKKAAGEDKKAAAAAKKAGKSVAVKAKTKANAKGKTKGKEAKEDVPEIPQTVLAKADKSGMTDVLKKLLCRGDIKDANISASKAIAALEESGGLMHPARRALLGA